MEAPQQPGARGGAAAGGESLPGRNAALRPQRALRQERAALGPGDERQTGPT